jgi:hypothetical protein
MTVDLADQTWQIPLRIINLRHRPSEEQRGAAVSNPDDDNDNIAVAMMTMMARI